LQAAIIALSEWSMIVLVASVTGWSDRSVRKNSCRLKPCRRRISLEEVVETAILLNDEDDVLDLRAAGREAG